MDLVHRSGLFPRILGVLLAIGELWFVAYLVVKGVRVPERPALVPAAV